MLIANAPATFFNGSAEVAFTHANLSSFFTTEATFANVLVTLPVGFTALTFGTITVKLGNITQTVLLSRLASIDGVASPLVFINDYLSATITSQETEGSLWLSFSTDGVTKGSTDLTLPTAGTVYLMVSNNVAVSGGVVRTGGEAYISRANLDGRINCQLIKILSIQGFNGSNPQHIAEESIVLLQNGNNFLPLDISSIKSLALIGSNADQVQ